MPSQLSACFPVYNEAGNLPELIDQATKLLPRLVNTYEIVLVDDGSVDESPRILDELAKNYPRVRVFCQPHLGYGAAVANALARSSSEWVFFSDSDLQFDLQDLSRLLALINDNDMAIGYRIRRADGRARLALQKLYAAWSKRLLGVPMSIMDVNCAFKLLRASLLRQVLPLVSKGALINAELLAKAARLNAKVGQTPVRHFPRRHGRQTGGSIRVVWKALYATLNLALYLRRWEPPESTWCSREHLHS